MPPAALITTAFTVTSTAADVLAGVDLTGVPAAAEHLWTVSTDLVSR